MSTASKDTLLVDPATFGSQVALLALAACGGDKTITMQQSTQQPLPRLASSNTATVLETLEKLTTICDRVDLFGGTAHRSNVERWILQSDASMIDLSMLDVSLIVHSFVAGYALTVADFAVFVRVYPSVAAWNVDDKKAHTSLVRWFDTLQNFAFVKAQFAHVQFDIAPSPLLEINVYTLIQKQPAPASAKPVTAAVTVATPAPIAAAGPTVTPAVVAAVAAVDKKNTKQEKSKPKEAKADASKKPAAASAGPPVVTRLDMRIGQILTVNPHPTDPRSYVLTVDLAESSGARTVISGLAEHITAEQLRSQLCVCMCNLQAANIKGVESNGRLLVATDSVNKTLKELIQPTDKTVAVGTRVFARGYEKVVSDTQCSSKNKDRIIDGLRTDENKTAKFDTLDLVYGDAQTPLFSTTIANGTVA